MTPGRVTNLTHGPIPDNLQHLQEKDNHAVGGIRSRNPDKRVAADLRIRRAPAGMQYNEEFKLMLYLCLLLLLFGVR